MSGFDPTVDEICERVWAATRSVYASRMLRLSEDIEIVVSQEIWATLAIAFRDAKAKYREAVQLSYEERVGEDGDIPGPTMRLFGTVVRISKDLEPHEVRFRAEVVV